MPGKVWDEITYPFLNFNGCIIEVQEWTSNFISHFIIDVIAMLVNRTTYVTRASTSMIISNILIAMFWVSSEFKTDLVVYSL